MCCISMAYIKRGFKEIIMNKTIIFDLDGTLTDSEEGILKSVTYALESFGYEIPPHETLLLFLGPPLVDSFQEHCGMALEEAEKCGVISRSFSTKPKYICFKSAILFFIEQGIFYDNSIRFYLTEIR